MLIKPGARVKVAVYYSARDRDQRNTMSVQFVDIISAGPPGVVAMWGLGEDRKYYLVRKAKDGMGWDSVQGDRGELG